MTDRDKRTVRIHYAEQENRAELINHLSDLARKLGYADDTIRATIQTRWMNADLIDLERSASRMRVELKSGSERR